jgi:UDP-N-acetylmuramate--alanine ligase
MKPRIHMVGIGGIGMSALAQILLERGEAVSGSDAHDSEMLQRLCGLGARVAIGHRRELVRGADRVVVSDAVPADNPEIEAARELGIPVQRRSQLLAQLMRGARGIGVSGTHGKTTVTAMIGEILTKAGLDPTVALGGEYPPFGGNARVGRGEWFVAEACEAYASFLDLRPDVAVVTNIEPEHLDYHKTGDRLRSAFVQFLERTPEQGCAVLCADCPELRSLTFAPHRRVVWYGTDPAAHVRGTEVETRNGGGTCTLWVDGRPSGVLRLAIPGTHNLLNALGAVTTALEAGVPLAASLDALAGFGGVSRRFEVLGEAAGLTFVDDYAHHPTEVAATIAAARAALPGRRIIAVFQPHLYSRTKDFAREFASALSAADLAVLTEIYPAREAPMPGVSSALIAEHMRRLEAEDGVLQLAKAELTTALPPNLQAGDVVLFMGAGDIGSIARGIFSRLKGRAINKQEVVAKE